MLTYTSEFMAYYTELQYRHKQFNIQSRQIIHELGREEAMRTLVLERMRNLLYRLVEHCELNEDEGYLDEAISRKPILGVEADRLRFEYRRLVRDLSHLISRLSSVTLDGPHLSTLREDFRKFMMMLKDAERSETTLLENGFNTFIF